MEEEDDEMYRPYLFLFSLLPKLLHYEWETAQTTEYLSFYRQWQMVGYISLFSGLSNTHAEIAVKFNKNKSSYVAVNKNNAF